MTCHPRTKHNEGCGCGRRSRRRGCEFRQKALPKKKNEMSETIFSDTSGCCHVLLYDYYYCYCWRELWWYLIGVLCGREGECSSVNEGMNGMRDD